ncbi:MAG: TIGR02221 family CRISPR-associated protein [Thermogutta sp.]|nr:TIGR02221 family CRISPR-associated protein [Thermogutta sp.]
MSTTVVSFLGTGQRATPNDPRSEYRTTTYRFTVPDGREFLYRTSLFGTALIRFLRETGTQIDRWIVLGSSASLWSELNQVLPDPGEVLEEYCRIDARVAEKNVDEEALSRWQASLNAHAAPLDLRLRLTGEALAMESQQQIARALFENIPRGNEVVFDVSHGFRHQPIIAGFMISLMRWTHRIQRLSFYSGVFEARQGDVAPVLALPICQELVDATEAAAILDVTGNYERVARCLGLDAESAWFLENTNQLGNARAQAQRLRKQASGGADVVHEELAALLQERLQWAEQLSFAERMRQSARSAIDRGDYFRAVVLGYEAVLIRAGQVLFPSADPLEHETRKQAEDGLFNRLTGGDKELLRDMQQTRNACAHGSRSRSGRVQQILGSPRHFRDLMGRAFDLFDRLPELLELQPPRAPQPDDAP